MNWYRLQREHEDGGYAFMEVGLDMHDDESQNRVYKTVDHTLVIKKATEDDAGSYICHDFSTTDRLIKSVMTQEAIETILSDTDKFRFFYHLDVLRPSKIPVDEVAENGILTRSPSPSEVLEDENLELFTDWQKWGRCSKCDKQGERKRLGVCVVKKADPDVLCHPWYIEAILSSNPTGVPCRSSVFTNHIDFKTRPDELLKETCEVKCTAADAGQGKALRISGLTDVLFGKKKKGMLKKTLKIEAGKDVFLICPGAQIDSVVVWLNNTRPLVGVIVRNLTNGRVDIDAHNILRIYRVTLKDDGKYQCIKDHKEQIEFRLKEP
ncbi:uncharacterized protein LOC126824353 [Patella vulgata]|uniref:uncharacterized protein LOC126824353 n=1 Tax=Patella vulgata TaxID=6465 RepID=UPI00217F954C|nr:uncharacterized protein LOC126824353 [Patella vulgata]